MQDNDNLTLLADATLHVMYQFYYIEYSSINMTGCMIEDAY